MTKAELIVEVAEEMNVSKHQAQNIIECTFRTIYTEVEKGSAVHAGAFVFKRKERAARKGRNPKTGEPIDIPASAYISCRVKL